MKDHIFNMGYLQLLENKGLIFLFQREIKIEGDKVFLCHSITYSKLLHYK